MERGRFRHSLSLTLRVCGGVCVCACACAGVCVNKLVWVFWLGRESSTRNRKGRVCLKNTLISHSAAWLLNNTTDVRKKTLKIMII